ncbi:MAG: ABC transporter substrate-binding protein, partial [Spirillospora sp.]
ALLLAGCSGGDGPSGSAAPTIPPNGRRKRGGTFRLGDSQMSGATTTDIQTSASSFVIARAYTNTLMERAHDYRLRLGLAEEFAPVNGDLSKWTIRVRDGVEFHNGKTLDADDVIFTIRRNIDPKTAGFTSGLMASIDPDGIKKIDKRTVRLELKYPNSQLPDGFGEIPSGILPVGFDPMKPVGTGPFKQESFSPAARWVGARNDNYWKPGLPYLDRLELIGFASQEARLNALVAGQVDGIDRVIFSQVKQLQRRSNLQVVVSETGAFEPVALTTVKGSPFADPRARKAFKLMVDRKQLVNTVYAGFGTIGNDTGNWGGFDPNYPADIPQREQDLDQARALFKQAGLEGATIPMRLGEAVPGIFAAGDVLVQQAKAAGLNIKPDKFADLAQFYGSNAYYTSPLKIDYDYTQTVYDNLSYVWLPTGPFNSTSYDNPKVNALYKEALAATGARYKELIGEISRIIHDDGPWCVWGGRNIPDVIARTFIGLVPDAAGTGFNGLYFEEISLA